MNNQDKYTREVFYFSGQWEMPSHCGILKEERDGMTYVILTEMYETNPGSSVTSMIETIAKDILSIYGMDPGKAEFIVRTPMRNAHYTFYAETFYRALMKWDGERFTGLEWEKMEDFR
ncbi:MAG: hypothetical protein RBS55_03595 [Bacteroidales bacterium]|jgi:hypothetical protein|nr:hypothetical protein [Bacteroidales bacterium]